SRSSWPGKFLVQAGEKGIHEQGLYVEPDFFKIFHFQAVDGDPVAAMNDPASVVITQRTARKFFGNQDPIGKTLRLENERDLRVAAVIADLPPNSSVRFDVAMPFKIMEQLNIEWINTSWGNNSFQTWVSLHPQTDLAALNAKLENYIQSKNPDAAAHAFAYPLADLHLRGKFKEGKPNGGRIQILTLLGIIGLFVLLIACINFMNLATARSGIRAREVGVRKAIGAQRGLLIGQFLTEAMVMTFFALVVSLLLVKALLPGFNRLADKSLTLDFGNWQIWASILALGLLTGLVAGIYPAFFLSRFEPTRILRGNVMSTTKNSGALLRKGLVTFQFFISIFLIITTLVIHRQLEHINNRPLGYDAENLISIPVRGTMGDNYEVFKRELQQLPGVKSISTGTHNLVNFGSNTSGIQWPGKTEEQDFLISITDVGYDYTRTAAMEIVEGRDFSPEFGADSMACLLNETAVRMMGLQSPIGTVLRHDTTFTVVGVVKDFVYNDGAASVTPMVIYCVPRGGLNYFFVRFDNDGQWQQHLAQIEATSKKIFPDQPFEFRFVKDDYQRGFEGIRSTGLMANVFSVLAVFISCLGLFGLSAFFAERRAKEIGIRKVLGATVSGLWFFFSKDFFKPVLLAFALASVPAFWAMRELLTTFEYRIELSWQIFAMAGLAAVIVATFTVSFHSVRAALANPVKSLRSE
ncbi:MAG: ABC transporter permease, partial [Saprospiraceae bacterium]